MSQPHTDQSAAIWPANYVLKCLCAVVESAVFVAELRS